VRREAWSAEFVSIWIRPAQGVRHEPPDRLRRLFAGSAIAWLAATILFRATGRLRPGLLAAVQAEPGPRGRICPVPGVGRVIVGASGSPGSLRALRYGEVLARAHRTPLVPVIAWEPPGGAPAGRLNYSYELSKECQAVACRRLRDALVAVWGEVPDDPMVQPHVERGPAGWVLVSLAHRPGDLLVVGAGRRGALARLAFARVTRYCLARAQCPVLAVPPPALAREIGHGRLAWMYWHRPLTTEQILRDRPRPAA
jgi:nucleotide-binding universal stress UspA family protein